MTAREIRRGIAIRTNELKDQGVKSTVALEQARQEANKKHGKGWREKELFTEVMDREPTIYDDHENGEYWMD